MSSRDTILSRVKKVTEGLPSRTPLPDVEEVLALRSNLVPQSENLDTLVDLFRKRWIGVHGILLESVAELKELLRSENASKGYADPAALELIGEDLIEGVETQFERDRVNEYHFGITNASSGIAETGTVILTDRATSNRLSALAPWIHIAVLRKSDIKATVTDAIASFDDDPSIIMVAGPSKTADIEGVLIEGVHGPGKQACLLI